MISPVSPGLSLVCSHAIAISVTIEFDYTCNSIPLQDRIRDLFLGRRQSKMKSEVGMRKEEKNEG